MDDSVLGDSLSVVRRIDEQLSSLVQHIDIIKSVTPENYRQQQQHFFDSHYSTKPVFTYPAHAIDVHVAKRALYALPVEHIDHPELRQLYGDIIDAYADKLDQLSTIGSRQFLYSSLRYYGEPGPKDIKNARFLLHLPVEEDEEKSHNSEAIRQFIAGFSRTHGYEGTIELNDRMIANALVSGTKVKINTSARVSTTELHALAHHELGVHLLTTLNAKIQPVKALAFGCPVNTVTQEGLAIFCEFMSGHFSINRLRMLALRVLAVESMVNDRDFRVTFRLLKEQYKADDTTAFTVTARVYRGGGYTKDYLYLKGFRQVLNAYESLGDDFQLLLCGKTSLDHFDIIKKLVADGILQRPQHISPALKVPAQDNATYHYIVRALK